jgi:phage shock protein A
MTLLERVATLIKANLNDLIEKAEDPQKLLKQLLLDMQNQYMQLKTQVAMAVAEQHLLEQKRKEHLEAQKEWVDKADLALRRNDEQLARAALERSLTRESAAKDFAQQIQDEARQALFLRDSLYRLEQKMTETKARAELLIAQHRRARLAVQTGLITVDESEQDAVLERLRWKIAESEAIGQAQLAASTEPATVFVKIADLEREDRVNRLLEDLKVKLGSSAGR